MNAEKGGCNFSFSAFDVFAPLRQMLFTAQYFMQTRKATTEVARKNRK